MGQHMRQNKQTGWAPLSLGVKVMKRETASQRRRGWDGKGDNSDVEVSLSACCVYKVKQLQLKSWSWHLRGCRGKRELNRRNGDADGYTLHLGPPPKVNNVQGAICLGLKEGRGLRRAVWGGAESVGEGCNEHKHMEKQIFSLPAAVMKANVSMRRVHAWLCCTRHHHLALLAQPPSMGSSDTVEPVPGAKERTGTLFHMHTSTATPPALPALSHTRQQLTFAGKSRKVSKVFPVFCHPLRRFQQARTKPASSKLQLGFVWILFLLFFTTELTHQKPKSHSHLKNI